MGKELKIGTESDLSNGKTANRFFIRKGVEGGEGWKGNTTGKRQNSTSHQKEERSARLLNVVKISYVGVKEKGGSKHS